MTDLKNKPEEALEINPMNNKKYIEAVSFRDWQTCDLICDEHSALVGRIKNLEKYLDLALNALQRESEENEILKQELAQSKKEADTLNTDWYKCASLNGQLNIQNRKLEQELQKTRERHEKCMISFGIKLTEVQDKHDELLNELQKTREQLKECSEFLEIALGADPTSDEFCDAQEFAYKNKQFKDKQGE